MRPVEALIYLDRDGRVCVRVDGYRIRGENFIEALDVLSERLEKERGRVPYSYEDICARALEKWGVSVQLTKAIEELAELIVELAKSKGANDEQVIDELADVQIMTWQMAQVFGEKDFDDRVSYKITRLKERIEAD